MLSPASTRTFSTSFQPVSLASCAAAASLSGKTGAGPLFRHCNFTERVLHARLLWLCVNYADKELPELIAGKLRFRTLLSPQFRNS